MHFACTHYQRPDFVKHGEAKVKCNLIPILTSQNIHWWVNTISLSLQSGKLLSQQKLPTPKDFEIFMHVWIWEIGMHRYLKPNFTFIDFMLFWHANLQIIKRRQFYLNLLIRENLALVTVSYNLKDQAKDHLSMKVHVIGNQNQNLKLKIYLHHKHIYAFPFTFRFHNAKWC